MNALLKIKMPGSLAGFLLLMVGCSVGSDYQTPAVQLPAAWLNASSERFDSQPAALARWWTEFDDPLLHSLVERAVQLNLDLRVAKARLREARAVLGAAGADLWPTLDLEGRYSRNRSSENAFAIGSLAPRGGNDLEQNLFRIGFDASWEVDVFGGSQRRVEAAQASLDASVEEWRSVLVTLLGDVARNYVELRGLQRRLAVAQANLSAQQVTARLTKVRFDAGLASDLEVVQAEGLANQSAAQLPVLESALKQTAYRLDVLLGGQPGMLWQELERPAPIPALPPTAHVGLPTELLRRRPDIRRAERQLAAATAQVGAATADLYPKLSLTGAFGLQSISAADWISGGSRFWSIGPTISWPIFDAARIRANIDIRSAQQEQALRSYEQSVLVALGEVESALVGYANEQSRYHALLEAAAAQRRAVTLANELYRQGLVSFLNVLDAERTLNAAENDLAQSETNMASNLVALYKALGGGWDTN